MKKKFKTRTKKKSTFHILLRMQGWKYIGNGIYEINLKKKV